MLTCVGMIMMSSLVGSSASELEAGTSFVNKSWAGLVSAAIQVAPTQGTKLKTSGLHAAAEWLRANSCAPAKGSVDRRGRRGRRMLLRLVLGDKHTTCV